MNVSNVSKQQVQAGICSSILITSSLKYAENNKDYQKLNIVSWIDKFIFYL